jgi:hypothetical protein
MTRPATSQVSRYPSLVRDLAFSSTTIPPSKKPDSTKSSPTNSPPTMLFTRLKNSATVASTAIHGQAASFKSGNPSRRSSHSLSKFSTQRPTYRSSRIEDPAVSVGETSKRRSSAGRTSRYDSTNHMPSRTPASGYRRKANALSQNGRRSTWCARTPKSAAQPLRANTFPSCVDDSSRGHYVSFADPDCLNSELHVGTSTRSPASPTTRLGIDKTNDSRNVTALGPTSFWKRPEQDRYM